MMADKQQHQSYPLAPSNGYARSDQGAGSELSNELRRKKRMKYLTYGVAFVVFQTVIITIFALTVMKVKTPKFRVRSATFGTFDVPANGTSFNINMIAEVGVKNPNFGRYKYDNSTIAFFYGDVQVGTVSVFKAKAKLKSTRKFTVTVDLSSTNIPTNSELGNDISAGVLPLTSRSTLKGKVELMMVMKKKKSTQMNCSMEIHIQSRQLQKVICK